MSEPNMAVLNDVLDHIWKLPEAHTSCMRKQVDYNGNSKEYDGDYWTQDEWYLEEDEYTCGTAACFAGWVYHRHVEPLDSLSVGIQRVKEESQNVMRIDDETFASLTHGSNDRRDLTACIQLIGLGYTKIPREQVCKQAEHNAEKLKDKYTNE